MTAVLAAVAQSAARFRARWLAVAGVTSVAFTVLAALVFRKVASRPADETLVSAVFGITLPVLAYAFAAQTCARRSLGNAQRELRVFGANGWVASAATISTAAVALALAGAVLALVGVVVARGPADPELLGDVLTSTRIGLLGGAAYGVWFTAASSFGRNGGGRAWALVLDWLLGGGTSALALPWPRAHLLNLLGAPPVLELPQWASSLALWLAISVYGAVGVLRTAR